MFAYKASIELTTNYKIKSINYIPGVNGSVSDPSSGGVIDGYKVCKGLEGSGLAILPRDIFQVWHFIAFPYLILIMAVI